MILGIMSLQASLRKREVTGTLDVQTIQKMMIENLADMFNHEYVFDHHKLIEVFQHLVDKIKTCPIALSWIYMIYMDSEMDDDISIVWLATRYANKYNDSSLLSLCDEIKDDSL